MDTKTGAADGSWETALKTAKEIGYIPAAFTEAIRLLYADHFQHNRELRPVTKYQIARVLRSPNFKSMLYYASKSLASDIIKGSDHLTVGSMMELYAPLDLATMIAALVVSRKARRLAPPELWSEIRPHFARDSIVGGYVGVAIPSLGFSPGILWGAMPHIAHALMAAKKPETYGEYRQKLRVAKKMSDPALEIAIWGTSSSQVSSVLLTQLGFRKDFSSLLDRASTYGQAITTIDDETFREMRLALLWFNCFRTGSEQPRERLPSKFFPFKTDRERVDSYLKNLTDTDISWLERNGDDVSAEKSPELFKAAPGTGEFEVPDQLKEVFTLDEITSMEEVDFDKLVDHIDLENDQQDSGEILSTNQLKELEEMVG